MLRFALLQDILLYMAKRSLMLVCQLYWFMDTMMFNLLILLNYGRLHHLSPLFATVRFMLADLLTTKVSFTCT
ncbi:Uncharacterised protein [Mycobacterium tuberculosis]|nr:Uncharacterised protein [Mycobacterium tuberculosis]